MKLGRNFDKVRRALDECGPARRALYGKRATIVVWATMSMHPTAAARAHAARARAETPDDR
ncbi:hypothetical protein BMUNKI379_02380 [Burkholderia multivorans]|nr:hypothetical protein BMUNKI379_02380 [Burkholderia multivorans]